MEDTADHQEKEESEHQSGGTAHDDAWWVGSMNSLTRESRIRWADHTPQKGATNRFVCSPSRVRQWSYRKYCHARERVFSHAEAWPAESSVPQR